MCNCGDVVNQFHYGKTRKDWEKTITNSNKTDVLLPVDYKSTSQNPKILLKSFKCKECGARK